MKIMRSGGDSLTQYPPLFSLDSKFLFCTCGFEIKVFSTETGKNIQRLVGHEEEVTGISHHPRITLQILSSSLDQTIKIWDYEDGVLLTTYKIGFPLLGIYTQKNRKDIVLVLEQNDKSCLSKIEIEALNSSSDSGKDIETTILATGVHNKLPRAVGFLPQGNVIVFCKKKTLCTLDINKPNKVQEHGDKKGGRITCIACHPTDNVCVTGQSSGIIKFWHNLHQTDRNQSKKKKQDLIVSSQHWHSKEVRDVHFTPGGASLLSIGTESVLVQWIYNESGSKKDFFPRLGTPAQHVAVSYDGSLYATTHMDNSLLLITNYFTIKHSLEGFTAVVERKNSGLQFLEYDWKTKSCVTNGKPGHLLFYHPYTDSQLYNLDIVHQNYIASEMGSNLPQTIISSVAFSLQTKSKIGKENNASKSTWMATVEENPEAVNSREQKLKFWVFDETEQWWKLNTVVNDPHKSAITKVVFRPSSDVGRAQSTTLLTTSIDGLAKIWTVKVGNESSFWCCVTAASYRNHPVFDGDFSQDGSIAATAFGNKVCLSDPELLQDLTVLFSFAEGENIKCLRFGKHSCQHMLMVALDDILHACNLLTGEILWSVNTAVKYIISDPLSTFMAAITKCNDLFVFQPISSIPVCTQKKLSENSIISASFIPSTYSTQKSWLQNDTTVEWMQHSRIFFVDSSMSVFTICTEEETKNKQNLSKVSNMLNFDSESLKTPLASVLQGTNINKETIPGSEDTSSYIDYDSSASSLKEILDMPSHIAPPVSTLAKGFLLSFLPKRDLSKEKVEEDDSNTTIKYNIYSKEAEESSETESITEKMDDLEILSLVDKNTFKCFENIFDKS